MTNEQNTSNSQEDQIDSLVEEAKQFYNMSKDYRRERYMNNELQAYVIDKQFISKWKEYVNYKQVKKREQFSFYTHEPIKNKFKKAPFPGKIDNERLLYKNEEFFNDGEAENPENTVIRHDIDQRNDYRLVNEIIWNFFFEKYGGGPKIIKYQIEEKTKNSHYSKKLIEIFYRKFDLIIFPDKAELNATFIDEQLKPKPIFISRIKNLKELKEKILKVALNNISLSGIEDIRLWKINTKMDDFKSSFHKNLQKLKEGDKPFHFEDLLYLEYDADSTLEDLDFFDVDTCIVEIKNPEFLFEIRQIESREGHCEWCRNKRKLRYFCECRDVWYCCDECKERDVRFHEDKCKKKFEIEESQLKKTSDSRLGVVGLSNLGNTCFMNTALQCISNCWEITNFFLEGHYKNQLNLDNPIGSQGVLARSYANLVTNLWYGTSQVFSPKKFKKAIECFQSMFSGYQQHDTQEFLNYLLDGLHEDLNKVLKKPLVEKYESDEPDDIKSKQSWIGFLRRNQSILVELLYGQYKSTLYCPDEECGNVSVTFDPFLSVSLPLAARTSTYVITCFYLFYNLHEKAIRIDIPFNSECTVMALRNKVALIMNIHPFSFIVAKLDQSFENLIGNSSLLRNSRDNESKRIFLIQINPELFYSNINSNFTPEFTPLTNGEIREAIKDEKKNNKIFSEEYEENESGQTSEKMCYYSKIESKYTKVPHIKINDDNNFGFSEDFIKVIIHLKRYDGNDTSYRTRIILPRFIFINKKWTLKQAHHEIFKFVLPILLKKEQKSGKSIETLREKSISELFGTFFKDFEANHDRKDSVSYQKEKKWPYRIRLKNHQTSMYECYYCGKKCDDCLLQYSDLTIQDILDKIPEYEGNKIDNNFLYLRENQRFWAVKNRDLSLELSFLEEYSDSVKTLTDFDDLSFEIRKNSSARSVSINDCFKNFVKLEILKEDNEWYCPVCKKFQKAKKKMEIFNVPHVLIIHLKRFSASSKIDTLVDFPIDNLDLSNFVINKIPGQSLDYELFAISNHFGSLGGGHYVAYAKNHFSNKWYNFNDSSVHQIQEDDLVTSSAYVLFYKRKNLDINLNELYTKPFENFEPVKMEID